MAETIHRRFHVDFEATIRPSIVRPNQPPGYRIKGTVIWDTLEWDDNEAKAVGDLVLKTIHEHGRSLGELAESVLKKLKVELPGRAVTVQVGAFEVMCGPGPLEPLPKVFEEQGG